jgi:hypothetical protein
MRDERGDLFGQPGCHGQRIQDRPYLRAVLSPPQAQRVRSVRPGGQQPQPDQVTLPGQLMRPPRLPHPGTVDDLRRRAVGDGDDEGSEELAAGLSPRAPRRALSRHDGIVRMARKFRHLIAAPDPQRHRGENVLELAVVSGGEQPERAPFARRQRRAPQSEDVTLRRQLAGVRSLAGADVRDGFFRRPIRNVSGHGHEVLHGLRLPSCYQAWLPARPSAPGKIPGPPLGSRTVIGRD